MATPRRKPAERRKGFEKIIGGPKDPYWIVPQKGGYALGSLQRKSDSKFDAFQVHFDMPSITEKEAAVRAKKAIRSHNISAGMKLGKAQRAKGSARKSPGKRPKR